MFGMRAARHQSPWGRSSLRRRCQFLPCHCRHDAFDAYVTPNTICHWFHRHAQYLPWCLTLIHSASAAIILVSAFDDGLSPFIIVFLYWVAMPFLGYWENSIAAADHIYHVIGFKIDIYYYVIIRFSILPLSAVALRRYAIRLFTPSSCHCYYCRQHVARWLFTHVTLSSTYFRCHIIVCRHFR